MIGLLCGAFLGASVVFFRGAALALGDGEVIMRAAFALAVSLVMQTVIMGAYLLLREPGQMTAILRHWRSEEHTSELQSLMRISYAVFCLKKKKNKNITQQQHR